jgi:DNA gyrase/topoisomerase IV subunit B
MSDNKTPPPLYDESMILRLKPIEHVRFRPGMYIGGVDEAASYHLLFEFIDYLVRKHDFAGIYGDTVGRCDQLTITLLDDYWISISSNGPSIRVDKDTQLEKAIVELLMTLGWGQISLVQCVMLNALSSDLKITLKRDTSRVNRKQI